MRSDSAQNVQLLLDIESLPWLLSHDIRISQQKQLSQTLVTGPAHVISAAGTFSCLTDIGHAYRSVAQIIVFVHHHKQ